MISLNETLLTAAGLLGLVASTGRPADPQAFRDFIPEDDSPLDERRTLSPEEAAADDPFFTAVADALREAGYLDS